MTDDEQPGPTGRDAGRRGERPEALDYFGDGDTAPAPRVAVPAAAESARTERSDDAPPRDVRQPRRLLPAPRWRSLRREVLGVIVVVVLVAVCGALALVVMQKSQVQEAAARRAAVGYTAPMMASTAPGPLTVVIGDASVTAASSGVTSAQRWPEALQDSLRADLTTYASPNAGYTRRGSNGQTFVQAAAKIPEDADIVIFIGGAADASADTVALGRAATQAFGDATDRLPDATIIAVGPLFTPSGTLSSRIASIRTTLQTAARVSGVAWVDPIKAGWLRGVSGTGDLTTASERTITDRIQQAIESTADR